MSNEDDTVWTVFNGEIYNFSDLRSMLERCGHRFDTRSDTEVIVHGYEEWGDEVVDRLDGMFAFGLWDDRKKRLLLGRDRAGKKPLFVQRLGDRLGFASEVKALLALPDADNRLRPESIPLYLTYGYVPTPGTMYQTIQKLPPATILTAESDGTTEQRRYWKINFRSGRSAPGAAAERVRHLVRESVAARLVADVPMGAFLSGGIDSTIVVGVMQELREDPVQTFSIGFADDPTYDETHYARMAAEHFGTRHTEFVVEAQAVEILDELLDAYDEPFADSSAIPSYILSKLARDRVTVALTGDGGDEAFAGYLRFRAAAAADRLPTWLLRAGRWLSRGIPHHSNFRSMSRRARRFFEAADMPLDERLLHWTGVFAASTRLLLRPEWRNLLSGDERLRSLTESLEHCEEETALSNVLTMNFHTYLPDDLLVKADRCSMAHGLELRSPLLDTKLIEFAASLPDSLRIHGRHFKYILREAFGALIPDPIKKRGKMGFGVPVPLWFRTRWRPLVEDRILDPRSPLYTWIEPEPISRMAHSHFDGSQDFGHQLWSLLTLDTWLRRNRYSL